MTKQAHAKMEWVVEAVRHGLEGDAAVAFIHRHGYAMTVAGIARHLRQMGGRGSLQDLINHGKTNREVLQILLPDEDLGDLPDDLPSQGDLFAEARPPDVDPALLPTYDTRKLTVKLPEDVYEALRFAAKAEQKSQNDLIVEILTRALSQMPVDADEE